MVNVNHVRPYIFMLSYLPSNMGLLVYLSTMHPLLPIWLCISLCLLYVISTELRRHRKLALAGPPTYPVIGCLFSFYKNSHRLLDWYTHLLSRSPTQTIVIRRLGARRTVVTANPDNVEHMLKTNFGNYPKGKAFTEILGDFLGCGIFNVDGERWRIQRKLASHEFSAKSIRDYAVNVLEEQVKGKLVPILDSLAGEDDKVVDLQQLLRKLAFDIVCKVSLGIDTCALDSPLSDSSLARAFNVASEISARRASEPLFVIWKIKRFFGIGSERRLREAIDEIHGFVMKVIKEKEEVMEEDGVDLLSKMILAGYDEMILRDMMISFIVAGRDTTSAAMTWLFYLLSCHPDAEKEAVKELGFFEEERLSHYETLQEMKFLKACLCESMRLYPPVAWDSKHALADDFLPDGTPVHAGDRVTYFPYGMGRMEKLWGKDWFEFKPNRWFAGPEEEQRGDSGAGELRKVCPYRFPVFQAGPRVCLGREMAFIQMKFVVASLLKRFEIRPAGSDRPTFVPLLTAHMAGGFKVFVRRRQETVGISPQKLR